MGRGGALQLDRKSHDWNAWHMPLTRLRYGLKQYSQVLTGMLIAQAAQCAIYANLYVTLSDGIIYLSYRPRAKNVRFTNQAPLFTLA